MRPSADGKKSGFTLIELLVAVAVIALLLAILLPSLSRARLKAKVVKVHAELRGVCNAIDTYHGELNAYPLAQSFCAGESQNMSQYYELPAELFAGGYLSGRAQRDGRHEYSRFKDAFDPEANSYKYIKPGVGWGNNHQLTKYRIWVPDDMPNDQGQDTLYPTYKENPAPDAAPWERWIIDKQSPVAYAVWSCGPGGPVDWLAFQESQMSDDPNRSHLPVPPRNWYPNKGTNGESILCHVTTSQHSPMGPGHRIISPP
jgi:prepilin-type N-terminal cleavage/methylation domain-containing protein